MTVIDGASLRVLSPVLGNVTRYRLPVTPQHGRALSIEGPRPELNSDGVSSVVEVYNSQPRPALRLSSFPPLSHSILSRPMTPLLFSPVYPLAERHTLHALGKHLAGNQNTQSDPQAHMDSGIQIPSRIQLCTANGITLARLYYPRIPRESVGRCLGEN
jgi:hypothetical protein